MSASKKPKVSPGALVASAIIGTFLLYLSLSSFGLFHNMLSWDGKNTAWGWKVTGAIFLALSAYVFVQMQRGNATVNTGNIAFILICLFLSTGFNTAFKFTSGDIKQRVSYLDPQGRVSDTAILYKYYDDFYHFSTNPELKWYVNMYGELPGRNMHNTYILNGELPPSQAPRANEDFKWHEGAYEMK